MNKFKSGDLVSLRKGSPVMEVIMPSTSVASTYICGWLVPQHLDRSEVEYYFNKCRRAGYNMVQIQVMDAVPSYNIYGQQSLPYGWDFSKADPEGVYSYWDHLDYNTVKKLKDRIGAVICPLGVGEHFEYWGFDKERLIELDWNEDANLAPGFMIHCLPARHFSGRRLTANQSLWASFLLEAPSQKIYIGGDGGYDTHYAEIGNRFPGIDLAILENEKNLI
jgi:uncharacterized protein YodC (DUF2158 family)